jgi:hypothetical protein
MVCRAWDTIKLGWVHTPLYPPPGGLGIKRNSTLTLSLGPTKALISTMMPYFLFLLLSEGSFFKNCLSRVVHFNTPFAFAHTLHVHDTNERLCTKLLFFATVAFAFSRDSHCCAYCMQASHPSRSRPSHPSRSQLTTHDTNEKICTKLLFFATVAFFAFSRDSHCCAYHCKHRQFSFGIDSAVLILLSTNPPICTYTRNIITA